MNMLEWTVLDQAARALELQVLIAVFTLEAREAVAAVTRADAARSSPSRRLREAA